MKSIEELRKTTDPDRVSALGAVRRMAITLTAKALWQLAGFVIDGATEVIKAEPFAGIGIAARPPSSGKPEAIVIMVGDAKNPMVIAVRDEKTRAAIAGALLADESMLYNSQAFVHVKADGTIEARTKNGAAVALALKSDVQSAVTTYNAHTHLYAPGPGTPVVTAVPVALMTAPVGTTKLKGE